MGTTIVTRKFMIMTMIIKSIIIRYMVTIMIRNTMMMIKNTKTIITTMTMIMIITRKETNVIMKTVSKFVVIFMIL